HEGASIRTWRRIWPAARVVGMDVNAFAPVDGATLVRGDCTKLTDSEFVAEDYGPFDVVIDDASHQLDQIVASFDIFAPHMRIGGVYVIEDTLIQPNPWYACTVDVVWELRQRDHRPTVIVP